MLIKKVNILLVLILFLASCKSSNEVASTKLIQKRKYRSGFYVNKKSVSEITKKEKQTGSSRISIAKINSKKEFNTISDSKISTIKIDPINSKTSFTKYDNNALNDQREGASNKELNQKKSEHLKNITSSSKYRSNKKLEPIGLSSFISLMVGLSIFAIASTIAIPQFIAFIGIGLILASLVLCFISLSRFKKHKNIYRGKGWALATLFIWGAGILAGIIILLSSAGQIY